MLTERQIQLLQSIINEYISTAEPVGSVDVVKKYKFTCSPATMRNEMAKLVSLGYLEMEHTSSGRVPTRNAFRYYIDELLQEVEMPVLQEVAFKQRLWPNRYAFAKLLHEAVLALSDFTKLLALTTSEDGYINHAGAVNMLDNKEFWDIDVTRTTLMLLDNYEMLDTVLKKAEFGEDVRFVIGEEIGLENLERCALAFTPYTAGERHGYIAVLGPSRMNYGQVVPAVRYTKGLIEELGGAW